LLGLLFDLEYGEDTLSDMIVDFQRATRRYIPERKLRGFYFVDRYYGSALHGDRGAACREAQTNFANEAAKIHGSQGVLKMLFLYT
jgi:hypothetical protein